MSKQREQRVEEVCLISIGADVNALNVAFLKSPYVKKADYAVFTYLASEFEHWANAIYKDLRKGEIKNDHRA